MLTPVPVLLKVGPKVKTADGPPALVARRVGSLSSPTPDQLLAYAGALRAEMVYGGTVGLAEEYVATLASLYGAHVKAATGRKYDGEAVKHYLMAANAAEVYHVAKVKYEVGGTSISPDAAAWCEFAALETAVCSSKPNAATLLGVAEEALLLLPDVPAAALFWRGRAATALATQSSSSEGETALRYWTAGKMFLEEGLRGDCGAHTKAEIRKQLDEVNRSSHQLSVQLAKTALARGTHLVAIRGKLDDIEMSPLPWPEPSARQDWSEALRARFQRLLIGETDTYWAPKLTTTPIVTSAPPNLTLILGVSEAELTKACRDKTEARRVVLAALRGMMGERGRFSHARGEIDGRGDDTAKLLKRVDESFQSLFVTESH